MMIKTYKVNPYTHVTPIHTKFCENVNISMSFIWHTPIDYTSEHERMIW